MPDFELRMMDSGHSVFLTLLPGVIEMVRQVGVHQIVLLTRYGPARALADVVCARATNWTCSAVVGWYPYDFKTRDLYAFPTSRRKQGNTCPCSVPYGRIRPVKIEGEDLVRVAAERVQRETALAAAKERRRWDRASTAKKKESVREIR